MKPEGTENLDMEVMLFIGKAGHLDEQQLPLLSKMIH